MHRVRGRRGRAAVQAGVPGELHRAQSGLERIEGRVAGKIRAVARLMTSINGMRGKFGQANYAAAKAGLFGLTKTAAREFGKKGVTVNAVAPGMVMTDMARTLPEEILARAAGEAALSELDNPTDGKKAV